MATVQTVLGPVEAGQLGRVLMHEHLLCLLPGLHLSQRGVPADARRAWRPGRADRPDDAGQPGAHPEPGRLALTGRLIPNEVQFPGRPVWGALG